MTTKTFKQTAYSKKLQDPRWQKKRLEVLNRDKFTCQCCGDDKKSLHVHHKYYESGYEPWDYELDTLITLCNSCHEEETLFMKEQMESFIFYSKANRNFLFSEMFYIMQSMTTLVIPSGMQKNYYEVLCWAFDNNPQVSETLYKMYQKRPKKKYVPIDIENLEDIF